MKKETISRSEAAKLLNVKPHTMRAWAAADMGPSRLKAGKSGRSALYNRQEIEALAEAVRRGEANLPTAKEVHPYYREARQIEARANQLQEELELANQKIAKLKTLLRNSYQQFDNLRVVLSSTGPKQEAADTTQQSGLQSKQLQTINALKDENERLRTSINRLREQQRPPKPKPQQQTSHRPRIYSQLTAENTQLRLRNEQLQAELDQALEQLVPPEEPHIDTGDIAGLKWANDMRNARKSELISEYIRIFGKNPRPNINVETLRKKVINASPTHQLLRGKLVPR